MSEIKALEKMAEFIDDQFIVNSLTYERGMEIVDAIETEIAEIKETTRKKHRAECVYWQNELCKILDAINGQERFWGIEYPLPEATISPSEVAKRMLSERYMLLPVDADGVPIHVGDAITLPNGSRDKVCFITIREHDTVFNERGWVPSQCTHVKPRTLEDVLNEFGIAAARELNADPYGYGISDKTIAKCVSEIRELLGGEGGGDDFQM